ncbi:hypothetical protein DFH07DRAFT_898692 [Mycena maculata]|uniref:protein-tyrosine-phosphatase n=1 Tax=Mycena maculata TaxID=230809 RepID=A0AAD7MJH8_9AGAR|nr:hypothetical protein DFH07DRAFT_898692 [Mycena maculata]
MANAARRGRPPNLTLQAPAKAANVELESPQELEFDDDEGLDLADDLSSPDPLSDMHDDDDDDEDPAFFTKSLERLEQLRRGIQQNLRLRPIRSNGSLPKVHVQLGDTSPWDPSITSPSSSISSYFTPLGEGPLSARFIGTNPPPPVAPRQTQAIEPGVLFDRLSAARRPLLIDTRPPAAHMAFHIRHSINLAIPSLILKRSKKTPFQSLDALRQYVTTEQGKRDWDALLRPGGPWDGDVVVYAEDEDMSLLPVMAPLVTYGGVDYLKGGISSAGHHPDLETLIISGGDYEQGQGTGLFQLDTNAAFRSKTLPEIDTRSSIDLKSSSTLAASLATLTINSAQPQPPRSPLPLMSSVMSSSSSTSVNPINVIDATPSPPPSQAGFRRPPPPPRRPSAPNLRKLDTKSAERLKLQVRTVPVKSATALAPPSPSHGSTSPSTPWTLSSPLSGTDEFPTAYFTPPHTPGTPRGGANGFNFARGFDPPPTARPDDPPTTEEPFPEFSISTILPNFLFLGPELTTPAHVAELRGLGVRRILNIAAECDDDQGLHLRTMFEKYVKIPMRDTVEEENIARGVREVCEILDDARLHSAPTYVHCKAGKSRSVTAVMAYLIHANHWTLSRAYAFVLERRKGISPNIGFVSELMTFEEEELGGKSVGVQPASAEADGTGANGAGGGHNANYGVAAGGRRGGHIRESLPPAFSQSQSFSAAPDAVQPASAGMDGAVGNSGQEMEIRDAAGRYRHARRAPVDENTLQPMRRVSKAGLESSAYS